MDIAKLMTYQQIFLLIQGKNLRTLGLI